MGDKWRFINHNNEQFGVQFGSEGGFMLHPDIPDAKKKVTLMLVAPELLEELKLMTALVRLKYGNLDKRVWDKTEETLALIARIEGGE